MFGDDGFGIGRLADCAVQEISGCVFVGRSDVTGEYWALPGIEREGGTTTVMFPGKYVVEGATGFATFDTKYPVLPGTFMLGGATCKPPWLDVGVLGK